MEPKDKTIKIVNGFIGNVSFFFDWDHEELSESQRIARGKEGSLISRGRPQLAAVRIRKEEESKTILYEFLEETEIRG